MSVYSASNPNSPKPLLKMDQTFANNFSTKSHPRNISVKLFQNLTSAFRKEDFLRISSCWYSTSSLLFTTAMFIDGSNFRKQLLKRDTSVKLFQNLTSAFFMSVYIVQVVPIHQSLVYGRIKISRSVFERVTQGTFL